MKPNYKPAAIRFTNVLHIITFQVCIIFPAYTLLAKHFGDSMFFPVSFVCVLLGWAVGRLEDMYPSIKTKLLTPQQAIASAFFSIIPIYNLVKQFTKK
jgi:hypothetical protein